LTTGSITLPSARGAYEEGYFESIARTTISTATNEINFSNIPQTYRHLQIRGIVRYDNNGISQLSTFQFNSDTGSNYSYHILRGEGHSGGVSSSGAASQTALIYPHATGNQAASGTFGAFIIDIFDYVNSNKYTTTRQFNGFVTNGGAEEQLHLSSGLWMNTAAITSIRFFCTGQNFDTHTTFALYGIKGI
jgi:hypothetical protein